MSGMGERIREGQRGHQKSQAGFQAASAAVAVVASSRGRVEGLRSGQPGMDAGLAAPGHGWPMAAGPRSRTGARAWRALASHRTKGAEALWLLSRFSKVTRRKGETNSRRYRNNGYTPNPLNAKPKTSIIRQRHLIIIRNTIPRTRIPWPHHRPDQRITHRTVRIHHRINIILHSGWNTVRTLVVKTRISRHTHLTQNVRVSNSRAGRKVWREPCPPRPV